MIISEENLKNLIELGIRKEREAIAKMIRSVASTVRRELTRDPGHANHVGEILDIVAMKVEERTKR